MFKGKDSQTDFFDGYVYGQLLPEEHPLRRIAQRVDFSFVEEEVRDLYSQDQGRPSHPPEVLFKMLFLEFYYNLSDVEVARQCQYNLLYRAFVGLAICEATPDDTTLVVFRRRLGEDRFERLFARIVQQCREQGLLEGRVKIVDATHVIADVAIPNTINLLREGRRRLIRAVEKETSREQPELRRRYQTEELVRGKPTAQELTDAAALTQKLVQEVKGRYGNRVEETVALVEKLLNPSREENVVSLSDPDARFGRKSPKKGFVGYKVHAAQDTSEIVTSLDLLRGNENEGSQLARILKNEEAQGLHPKALAADALYDSWENRRLLEEKGITAYIPARHKGPKARGFRHEPGQDRLYCSAGLGSHSANPQGEGHFYNFAVSPCRCCSLRSRCEAFQGHRSRVWLSRDRRYILKMPREAPQVVEQERKRIERKFGEAKKWHGLSRARYRGRWRVAIQAFMTFIVVNVKRMIRLLKTKERAWATT